MWFVSWPGKGGNSSPDPNIGTCRYVITPKNFSGGFGALCGRGVTDDAVKLYNPSVDLDNVPRGHPVCCSVGDLPDLRPKPNSDGSCRVHEVADGDSCKVILATYYPLSMNDLMNYNKNTYGWYGCEGGHPWINDKICVSSGTPPRPTPNPEAECGPLAPGDKYLSECPLKACCSSHGFCGLDEDHCKVIDSPTGAPGTHGCETHCDLAYVKGDPPSEFKKIGYFSTWNHARPCNRMRITDIPSTSDLTHIHLAFGGINPDFEVDFSTLHEDFDDFKNMKIFKKIISIGGWSFSNSQYSWPMFRSAVSDTNRARFVNNMVRFVVDNGLDGIDFDWEYPGAWDIPIEDGNGLVPYDPTDGSNYLEFLKELRAALPSDKSISIAAPASYWYLKNFPIAEMAKYLDYIIYMTYDFHGQWDYGNKWSQSGCEGGDCLRSHVNITETWNSLSMITKAGVPSNKVVPGIAFYGRSFQQVDPSCSGPSCKFTGPASGATPGVCTGTPGVLSTYEFTNIYNSNRKRDAYYDKVSDSWIMTYDKDQWVAMSDGAGADNRKKIFKENNLGGFVYWALD
ncbi:class V chitinase-like protein, partial [Coemansia mojavensis]